MIDGALVEVAVADGGLRARLSHDGGVNWTAPRQLAAEALATVAPVGLATHTGLAVAYAGADGQARFWHGSVERIVDGAPKASALRLDAPPEHVDAPHSLRA